MDTARAVENLDAALSELGTVERAAREKQYLKSDLRFYGVTLPQLRRITEDFQTGNPELSRDDLLDVVERLWAAPVHERRMVAVLLLSGNQELLEPADIDVVETLLRESRTWALVDGLAASVAGPLLDRHPDADEILDRWAVDADFWLRRSALLAHLVALRSGAGDFERFGRHADAMLDEKEFFIRKAIGWVLRDTARRRPELVYGWIKPRAARASGVTIREVVKPLSEEQAAAVRRAYESRRR